MCATCGFSDETAHLQWWYEEWTRRGDIEKADLTLFHISNRDAYHRWKERQRSDKVLEAFLANAAAWNDAGRPFDFDEFMAINQGIA